MAKSILVLKFGGTSVRDLDAMRQAVDITLHERYEHVLVVSSAISGVTNKLVSIANEIKDGNYNVSKQADEIIEIHTAIAKELQKVNINTDLHFKIQNQFKDLVSKVTAKRSLSDEDFAIFNAFGELLSTSLLIGVVQEREQSVKWFDIREVMKTEKNFYKANPEFELVEKHAQEKLIPILNENKLVITQGFIGSCESGETTLLGRGGSDYTASIIGAALNADQIEIWTDVDGLMTTDPQIVPQAQTIYDITYEEASELAYFGAKVLHPLTLLPSRMKGIPVLIRNTKNALHPGTTIHLRMTDDNFNGAKAIAYKKGITIVNIISSRMLMAYGFLKKVFKIFDEYKTAVDIVATSEVSISVTIDDSSNIDEICKELSEIGQVEVFKNQALVSIVGTGIRNLAGTAANVFGAIKNININMISQGASQTNLSFIIEEVDVEKAVQQLHRELIEQNPELKRKEKELCA